MTGKKPVPSVRPLDIRNSDCGLCSKLLLIRAPQTFPFWCANIRKEFQNIKEVARRLITLDGCEFACVTKFSNALKTMLVVLLTDLNNLSQYRAIPKLRLFFVRDFL